MKIKTEKIANQWNLFTLINNNGMTVSILDFGGIITKILVPDKQGKWENIVLGYKDIAAYAKNPHYLGAVIGRVAGRIQNASFSLDGKTFNLEKNDGEHHLHGGSTGLQHVVWQADPFHTDTAVGVKLTHKSPDGEGGYPGNIDVSVTYTLNNDNQLLMEYEAVTDKTTALTLTNHSYFNLSGNLKDTIHNHEVTMDSSRFLELDEALIPTGRQLDVTDTVFDFRYGQKLAEGMKSATEQIRIADGGYDHYFLFDGQKKENVVVRENESGRFLTIKTDQPGMVMYTANGLADGLALKEKESQKQLGVCFETQGPPASLHNNGFPSVTLKAGEPYHKRTIFTFGVKH